MDRKMGRPKKATSNEKIAIVNRYYIEESGEDASAFNAHGIYAKLSKYAKSIGVNLEAHDFSRDVAVQKYIKSISFSAQEDGSSISVPTYQPLDITALLSGSHKELAKTLSDRERYFESLHQRSAKAIENYALLAQKCEHLQAEVAAAKERCAQLEEEKQELRQSLISAKKDVAYLRRIIKRDVEPERAHQFLQGLTSPEAIADVVGKSVVNSINVLGKDDQKLWSEADKEINSANLLKLFG